VVSSWLPPLSAVSWREEQEFLLRKGVDVLLGKTLKPQTNPISTTSVTRLPAGTGEVTFKRL
jgi:hypothetical protein